MTPDVNVLVAAFRPEHPHHHAARGWLTATLEECARGGTLELLPMVAVGFVRLVTNRKAFPVPDPVEDALRFIESLQALPGVSMPSLGTEWSVFENLCAELKLAGNDVTDAWIAAAVRVHGLRLVTFDSGFARLLEPADWLLLEPRPGVQERSPPYVLRRVRLRRAA